MLSTEYGLNPGCSLGKNLRLSCPLSPSHTPVFLPFNSVLILSPRTDSVLVSLASSGRRLQSPSLTVEGARRPQPLGSQAYRRFPSQVEQEMVTWFLDDNGSFSFSTSWYRRWHFFGRSWENRLIFPTWPLIVCIHPLSLSSSYCLLLLQKLFLLHNASVRLSVGTVQIPSCHKFRGSPLYLPELAGSLKLIIWKAPKMELLRKKISSESCNTVKKCLLVAVWFGRFVD